MRDLNPKPLIWAVLCFALLGLVWRFNSNHRGVFGFRTADTNASDALSSGGVEQQSRTGNSRASRTRNRAAIGAPKFAGTESVFERMRNDTNGDVAKLPIQLIDAFVEKNRTNAESLIAAWQSGGGLDYLKKAAALYPDDPLVQMHIVALNTFPEQEREWIERFKKSDPDNSMPDYFSAKERLKAGDRDGALKDLLTADSKTRFKDYTTEKLQETEDLHLQSGQSAAEAKALSSMSMLLPQLAPMKALSKDMAEMQKQYLAAGDVDTANSIARMGLNLGEQLRSGEGGHFLINQLVGIAIEKIALDPFPATTQPPFLTTTIQERIDSLTAQRADFKSMSGLVDQMLARGNEAEIISFFDRMKTSGEAAALKWAAKNAGR